MSVYFTSRYRMWRTRVRNESGEVAISIHEQFDKINVLVNEYEDKLLSSRKTRKLTTAEESFISAIRDTISGGLRVVDKEVKDVTDLTD